MSRSGGRCSLLDGTLDGSRDFAPQCRACRFSSPLFFYREKIGGRSGTRKRKTKQRGKDASVFVKRKLLVVKASRSSEEAGSSVQRKPAITARKIGVILKRRERKEVHSFTVHCKKFADWNFKVSEVFFSFL